MKNIKSVRMKNFSLLAAILLFVAFASSCLKNEELPPPIIQLSQAENEILTFSTSQSANVKVHIESGDELRKFTTITVPMSSWSDTIVLFDNFVHRADFDLSFKLWAGYDIKKYNKDSIFEVTYSAYTDDTVVSVKRKLRYKHIYPSLDSFDIKLSSASNGLCLLDVANRRAYRYTEYTNHKFDLVYVCEMNPADYSFGTGLISPDAPYLMRYFQRKYPTSSLIYDPAKRSSTECGIIADATLDWPKFNGEMLGDENNWQPFTRIGALTPTDGVGVIDLQATGLYKFRLESGDLIMIKVLKRLYPQYADKSEVSLRVYLFK